MRLLLDTHIFLWAVSGSALLKSPARRLMEGADQLFVSAASIWEIAIKARLGKIDAEVRELVEAVGKSGFLELPVRAVHAAGVATLPLHHTDPFDRLLIAQAIAEPLKLLTAEPTLAGYGDLIVLV
ncbi:MAG: type II toxin-antitoxin system VapC family toxin [Steroidobacteraceae bacterium]